MGDGRGPKLFIDKVRDIVGSYLDPPEAAMVLAVDEKSQIQALDRTAPVLPMMPAAPGRQTHGYVEDCLPRPRGVGGVVAHAGHGGAEMVSAAGRRPVRPTRSGPEGVFGSAVNVGPPIDAGVLERAAERENLSVSTNGCGDSGGRSWYG